MSYHEINSLYIHFPFCRHLCNYCDFYRSVKTGDKDVENFEKYMEETFLKHASLLEENKAKLGKLKTIYFGGGTPSLWGVRGAKYFKSFIKKNNLVLDKNVEFTMEVNPGAWTKDSLDAWQDVGVNRFSVGLQTLDENFIKVIDRVHSIDDSYNTLEEFKRRKSNFSVDFLLGIPFEKKFSRSILNELSSVLTYGPSHFSVYILTVKENYPYFSDLPEESEIEESYLETADFLKKNRFSHYEVSNFSLEGKESSHNLQYWKGQSVAALGPSATGFLENSKIRYKWIGDSKRFSTERLTDDEYRLEFTYMNLRSKNGLKLSENFNLTDSFMKLLEKWEREGLCHIKNDMIFLTSKGYLILDSILDTIFSYQVLK